MIDGSAYERLKVSTSDDGAVVRLVLDHGKANEMGSAELRELERVARELAADADARALVTSSDKRSSKGTPIFVARLRRFMLQTPGTLTVQVVRADGTRSNQLTVQVLP